jgi:uncharacterized damage-inducible protein DinB
MTDRRTPFIVGDESTTLLAFLAYLRQSVVRKLDGLSEHDARRALVPSGTSLAGLVKHLTNNERYWMGHIWAGQPGAPADPDDWTVSRHESIDQLLDNYRAAWKDSDTLIEGAPDFDAPCAEEYRGHRMTLRWVITHLLEETARHAGHADITRELIDGSVGR